MRHRTDGFPAWQLKHRFSVVQGPTTCCRCATSKSVYLRHCLAEQVWIGVQIGGLAHCRFWIIFRSQQARTVSWARRCESPDVQRGRRLQFPCGRFSSSWGAGERGGDEGRWIRLHNNIPSSGHVRNSRSRSPKVHSWSLPVAFSFKSSRSISSDLNWKHPSVADDCLRPICAYQSSRTTVISSEPNHDDLYLRTNSFSGLEPLVCLLPTSE
jgi:hypothetical protein